MSGRVAWGVVVCLISPLVMGCANSAGMIRGQSPSHEQTAAPSSAVQQVSHNPFDKHKPPHWSRDHHGPVYHGTLVEHAGPGCENGSCNNGSCPGGNCPGGNCYGGDCNGGNCPSGDCYGNDCNGSCDDNCGHGRHCKGHGPWYPTHKTYFSYRPPQGDGCHPQGLVYPQQNTPAPVVQYPYYTVKGPDDFFLDNDG
jgi:hypothetical protein